MHLISVSIRTLSLSIPPSVFRTVVPSVSPSLSMVLNSNLTTFLVIRTRPVRLLIFPALMNSFLTPTPVLCLITAFVLVCRRLLLRLWEISALANPPIAVLAPVLAYRLRCHLRPCLCPRQRPQFCPRLVRPLLVLIPLGLAVLDLVILTIPVIALIQKTTLKPWTKNFLRPKTGFHPPSLFVHRKNPLGNQLWTSRWLVLRLSICLCRELPKLKI